MTAEEYKKIIDSGNQEKLNILQRKVEYKTFIFQVKPKVSNYNNTLRKKLQIINIDPINTKDETSRILKFLEQED